MRLWWQLSHRRVHLKADQVKNNLNVSANLEQTLYFNSEVTYRLEHVCTIFYITPRIHLWLDWSLNRIIKRRLCWDLCGVAHSHLYTPQFHLELVEKELEPKT